MTNISPTCELCVLHGMDDTPAVTTGAWNQLDGNAMYPPWTAHLCASCFE